MRYRQYVLLACAALAACAPMTESECRGTDWARLGEFDGMRGNQPRIDQYAYQCSRYHIVAPENTYMDGWRAGYAEFSRRVIGSMM